MTFIAASKDTKLVVNYGNMLVLILLIRYSLLAKKKQVIFDFVMLKCLTLITDVAIFGRSLFQLNIV